MRRLSDDEALEWIDRFLDAGSGSLVLQNHGAATVVEAALRHFDGRRYGLGEFVIMPNHVHALVQPATPYSLRTVTHGWKSFTAHQLQHLGYIAGKVWQEESFDRIVRNEDELRRFRSYINENPVTAKLKPGTFVLGRGTARWP